MNDEKIQDLLDKASKNKGCFATQLKGDAKTFVEAAILAKENGGTTITYAGVFKVLRDELGIETSATSVKNHMRGLCRCQKTKQKTS